MNDAFKVYVADELGWAATRVDDAAGALRELAFYEDMPHEFVVGLAVIIKHLNEATSGLDDLLASLNHGK